MAFSINEVYISKTVKWKQNIEKLLHYNICGVCLEDDDNLRSWEDVFHVKNFNIEDEQSLRNILIFTFGYHIIHMLPTTFFCDRCTSVILKSFLILKKIKLNHTILQKYLENISEQVNEMTRNTNDEYVSKVNREINQKGKIIMHKKKSERKLEITINPIELYSQDDQVVICQTNNTRLDSDNDASEYETKTDLKYECPYCALKSDDIKALRWHCYDCHSMETVYKCCKCRKKFKMLNKLVEHRNLIHSDNISSCEICNVILNDMGIQEHENIDHENLILICDACQSRFETKSSLLEHIAEIHSTGFTCQYCLQIFTNEFKLNHHRCIYKCFECNSECIHEKYLLSYREQHINNQKVLKCTDCDFTYTARSQLICHVNGDHLKHYPYLCDLCGEKFASKPLLRIHIYKRHNSEVTGITEGSSQTSYGICKLCNMVFNSKETYTSHRKRHLGEQSQCQFCSKVFCSITTLNMHLKTHHENKEDGHNTTYQCSMCPSDFNYKTDYLNHVATHPKGSKHGCRICNQEFVSKINYISHLRKHQIKYDKECHICFNKYTKHTINRHMRSHLKDSNKTSSKNVSLKSTMCDVCGALLQNEPSLIKHSETHKKEIKCPHCESRINTLLFAKHVKKHKKYEQNLKSCSKCDYTTRFSVCLEGHMNRYHFKIRPYRCELCPKSFYSEYTLKGHRQTHSAEREEHYCEVCGKKFISKKALVLHTRLHTGERPYPCDLCELSFLSASRREQHKIRKHFERSVECTLCDKKMYTNSDLRRHMSDCHNSEPKRRKKIMRQAVLTILDAD